MPATTATLQRYAEIDNTGYNVGQDVADHGEIAIRWAKLTYLDGILVGRDNHRTILHPDSDIDGTLDQVDSQLESEGYGRMPDEDREFIHGLADRFWTAEIVAAYNARKAEREALLQAELAAAAAAQEAQTISEADVGSVSDVIGDTPEAE